MKLKKLASILLTLCLVIAMAPFAVFAQTSDEDEASERGRDLYILGRVITESGTVSKDYVPYSGDKIEYNAGTKTLTLTNVELDLTTYSMPNTQNNYVAGICAWDDIKIVLNGTNSIKEGDGSYDSDKTYIYGLKNASGQTYIAGNGSLTITMDSSDSGRKFTGIASSRFLTVSEATVNVTMNGSGRSNGIDMRGDFGIQDEAHVTVTTVGESSTAVNGSGIFEDSYVARGAVLTMRSPGTAFKCYLASDMLKSLGNGNGAMVDLINADGSSKVDWDSTDPDLYLAKFKYVEFDTSGRGESVPVSERANKVYILGKKVDKTGDVSTELVPHTGTIHYDKDSNTLTLTDATLDLKDFTMLTQDGNMVVSIYSMTGLKIVLEGDSTIISSSEPYLSNNNIEHVYGIDAWGVLDISGSGTLNIALAGAEYESNAGSSINIYAIGTDDALEVRAATININMGDKGKPNGMYLWGPANFSGGAFVRITSKGASGYGFNGINDIGKSIVSSDSVLEITADNIAFNCWSAGGGLKEAGAMVNRAATSEGAGIWNQSTRLREYKYVRIPELEPIDTIVPGSDEFTITYDLNGGTLNEKTGEVTEKVAAGTVITLPLPERTGYEFDYWEGSKYNAGDKYTVTEDHTFKAIWKTAKTTDTGSKDKGKSSGVKTGDDSTLYTWIALMTISVLGFACVAIGRKISGRNI